MTKLLRLALIATLLVPAAGCSSTDDLQDAIAAVNPFGDSKKTLPGERQPATPTTTITAATRTRTP